MLRPTLTAILLGGCLACGGAPSVPASEETVGLDGQDAVTSAAPLAVEITPQGGASLAANQATVPTDLVGRWVLVGVDQERLTLDDRDKKPWIEISGDGRLTGFAGVNRINGALAATGETLFGPLMSTRMAGPERLMTLENGVLAGLTESTTYRIDGDRLILSRDDVDVLAWKQVESQ